MQDKQRILDGCCRILPSLREAEVVADWAGLRPYREPVRLELEQIQVPLVLLCVCFRCRRMVILTADLWVASGSALPMPKGVHFLFCLFMVILSIVLHLLRLWCICKKYLVCVSITRWGRHMYVS